MCMHMDTKAMQRELQVIGLLAVFIFLNVMDLLMTVYNVQHGYAVEGNLLMAWVLSSWGYGGFAMSKVVTVLPLCFLMSLVADRRWIWVTAWGLVLGMSLVVGYGLCIAFRGVWGML